MGSTTTTKAKSSTKPLTEAEKAAKRQKRQEEGRRRFLELAPKRTQNAIDALGRVQNCANRQGYAFSDEEAAKIVTALEEAVAEVKTAFSSTTKDASKFTL